MSLRFRESLRSSARSRRAILGRGLAEGALRSSRQRVSLEILEDRALMATSDPFAGFLTAPSKAAPLTIALDYLTANGRDFGFAPGDAARAAVTDQYTDAGSGTTHIYLAQSLDALQIQNARISIHVDAQGRVIFAGGDFVDGLGDRPSAPAPPSPTLSASQAIAAAAIQLGLTASGPLVQIGDPSGITQATKFSFPGISGRDIPAHLDYVAVGAGVRQAWAINLFSPDAADFHWYDVQVDATNGQIIGLNDWASDASDGSSYTVYSLPKESPNDGGRTLLLDPSNASASPFGWLDTDGKVGADSTRTFGNNTNAYADTKAQESGNGPRPNAGSSLAFDFPIDFTKQPSTYTDASTTNLFYLANILHDVHYIYGFDEVAGNFQLNNYGNGGVAGDAVMALDSYGSDVGQFNNAFMATPPDGDSPVMAMLQWTVTDPRRSGSFDADVVVHEFGHGVSNRLTGGPADANALDAIQSGGMGEGWSDWWALMFTQLPGDNQDTRRPVGNYVLGLPDSGPGIRRNPYSFNLTTNPITIAAYNGDGEVHDTGEIWASTLWDMNWLLVNKYGFNPKLSDGYQGPGSSGNLLALQLVMDALKLQPANPSFSDARNAILAADQALTGGANQFEIWTAFARRGMGFAFSDGGSPDSPVVVPDFNLPPVIFVQARLGLSVDENTPLDNVTVASFFDPITGQAPGKYQVTIKWGDGTTGPGAVSINNTGGFDITAAGKIYQQGGDYPVQITVVNSDSNRQGGNTETIHVIDAPFDASDPSALTSVEGTNSAFSFGSFQDTDTRQGVASTYTVAIDWGDGTFGTGTAIAQAGVFNGYDLVGVNKYPKYGTYTYKATVTGPGGSQAVFTSTAAISDAPLFSRSRPVGDPFKPVEGQFYSGIVVWFRDQNPDGVLADLSALITWGDGHTSAGTVINDTGGYAIRGANKYTTFGDKSYTVEIKSKGGSDLTMTGTVRVADAPITSQGTSFGQAEGTTFSGTVATIRDTNTSAPRSDYFGNISINWGDGSGTQTVANGDIVSVGAGTFLVKGTHKFNEEGIYTARIEVLGLGGGSTTSSLTTATITNTPLTGSVVGIGPLSTTEGVVLNDVVVSTFTSGNPTEPVADFLHKISQGDAVDSPLIDWGDGSTSFGTVTQVAGIYRVTGTHTYTSFGTYQIATSIADDYAAQRATTSTMIPIVVRDAAIRVVGSQNLEGREGVRFTDVLATFTDENTSADPSTSVRDFSAIITWGDTAVTDGVIAWNSTTGKFEVRGDHAYATRPEPYPVTIQVVSAGGSSQTVTSSIYVLNGRLVATSVPIDTGVPGHPSPKEGVRFNAAVATFTDENPTPAPGEYQATIYWGDGGVSAGIILADSGRFMVRGSHIYSNGNFNISMVVQDRAGGEARSIGSVVVEESKILVSPVAPFTLTEGTVFTDPVATFKSENPQATASSFLATINWGDGTSTNKVLIAPAAGGTFTVTGNDNHIYRYRADANVLPISVTVLSLSGANATVETTATVADAAIRLTARPQFLKVGQSSSPLIAGLIDANPLAQIGDTTAMISWGDGSASSTATLISNASNIAPELPTTAYLVSAGHIYRTSGNFLATVTATSLGGQVVRLDVPVTVSAAAITTTFDLFGAEEKSPLVGRAATFTTENALATADSFSATISWGDGGTSTGEIVPLTSGRFAVNGSHTYANSGTAAVTVAIRSSDGITAAAAGTITILDRYILVGGRLAPSSDTGASSSDGVTSVKQPVFIGTAEAGDLVTITGQRADMAAPVVIGRAVVGADGSWSLATSPLADGTYAIVASAADAGGHVSSPPVAFPNLVIDAAGPRITSVSLNPKTGKIVIAVQDDRAGFSDSELSKASNYSVSASDAGGLKPLTINGVNVTAGSGSATRVITLDAAVRGGSKRVSRARRFVLAINGANLSDLAGNALDERFFVPTSSSAPKNGYIAQLVSNGNTLAGPEIIQTKKASRPKPSRFQKA